MNSKEATEALRCQLLALHQTDAEAGAAAVARVACSACGQARGQECLEPGGQPRRPHAARLRAYLRIQAERLSRKAGAT